MTETGTPGVPERTQRRWRRLSPLLFVLLGFGAGIVASRLLPHPPRGRGSADGHRGDRGRERNREHGRERSPERGRQGSGERGAEFRERLARELDLDENQRAQLDAFVEGNHAEARAFWEDTHTRYRELRRRFREQLREILTEAQRERFDSWTSEMERRRDPESRGERGRRRPRGDPQGGQP